MQYITETDIVTYKMATYIFITVPEPKVSVVALNNQMIGNSLTLECNVSTIRSVGVSVDIMWSSSNGTVLKRTNGVNISSTTIGSQIYTDYYAVSQHLNTTDHGTLYQCASVINGTVTLYNFTIDVIGMHYITIIMYSIQHI